MTGASRMAAIARGEGCWFVPGGPDADLVLSTRVRVARNLDEARFATRASERDLLAVVDDARAAAQGVESLGGDDLLIMSELGPLDREVLVERHLISSEFNEPEEWRALILGRSDSVSVMVNEEDHLRIQGLRPGFQLYEAWDDVSAVDTALGHRLAYAFRDDVGFLTACPSNVGTGLRVSVLMHLPALVLSQEVRKVIDSVQQIGLTVRGFYGEGSDVVGNFFQISNQITLGKSEEELLDILRQVTREVMQYEIQARDWLWSEARNQILDKIHRAMGTLQHCRLISAAEVVAAASALRLGISLGIQDMPGIEILNRLVVFSQPAHVQRLVNRTLGSAEENVARATLVRRLMTGGEPTNGEV